LFKTETKSSEIASKSLDLVRPPFSNTFSFLKKDKIKNRTIGGYIINLYLLKMLKIIFVYSL
jgi:hypothetical protein